MTKTWTCFEHDIHCKYNKKLKFRMVTTNLNKNGHMNLIIEGDDDERRLPQVFHCVTASPKQIQDMLRAILEHYPVHISKGMKELVKDLVDDQKDK